MALDVKALVHGIKFLIASEGTKQTEQASSFVGNLEIFLAHFESFVSGKEALSLALAAKQEKFHISVGLSDSLYWRYTANSLCLLCTLVDMLSEEQPSAVSGLPSPLHAPKHMLGVTDQKLVQCLLQRVVYVGIYPYLLPGVDSLVKLRLGHLRGATKADASLEQSAWYLVKCSQMLLHCAEEQTLGPLVLGHHLSDLLVALMQVCYGPRRDSSAVAKPHPQGTERFAQGHHPECCQDRDGETPREESCTLIADHDRAWCADALSGLLDRIHQPTVVRELLCLQRGAPKVFPGGDQKMEQGTESAKNLKWLQRACGRLLSERLMKKNGVQSVLRGILDTMAGSSEGPEKEEGGEHNWKKCKAIAQIIAHCPFQAHSTEQYYSLVCPQVLDLLHLPADETQRQVLRVTVAIMDAMVTQNGPLADRFLIYPLLRPLEALSTAGGLSACCPTQSNVHANQWRLASLVASSDHEAAGKHLQTCINDVCKICGVLEVTSSLVSVFAQYLPMFFELSCVCDGQDHTDLSSAHHSDHQARSPATAVLCFLLSAVDSDSALKHLVSFATAPEHGTTGLKRVSPCWTLSCASGPGKLLTVSTTLRNEGGLQELDKMEGKASHVVRLLKSELKAHKLAGKLCLTCLSNVEKVLHKAIYEPGTGGDLSESTGRGSERTSSVLLDLEGGDATAEHIPALFLVASLCEHMTMEVMEQTDIHQMLEVILRIVMAYGDFVHVEGSSSRAQGLLLVQPDLDSLPGSVIPLSISIGLLSSIMGGVRKVGRDDRPLLTQFLHPLEVISSNCPIPELQTQVSELRICIATMGAVWSSELDTLGSKLTEKVKGTMRKETKSKLIEEMPVSVPASISATITDRKHPGHVKEHPCGTEECPGRVKEHLGGVKEHHGGDKRCPAGVENEHKSQPSAFQAALVDLQDPLLPIQAHGLSALAKLVAARDSEALACSSSLMLVFKENLKHSDSYVYLAAIDGLVALASTRPKDIVPLLCQEYVYLSGPEASGQEKGLSEKVQHVLKLGEALVRTARTLGDILPHYSEMLLPAIMVNLRSPDVAVRTSALSNLADVCGMLHWSFGRIQNEVLGDITHILQTDKEPSTRQGALLVLKLLIKGLSQDAIQLLGGSLRDVYRLLKQVEATERDPLTQAHAQAALGELDSVMRAYLFPQETLTKKISILDPV